MTPAPLGFKFKKTTMTKKQDSEEPYIIPKIIITSIKSNPASPTSSLSINKLFIN